MALASAFMKDLRLLAISPLGRLTSWVSLLFGTSLTSTGPRPRLLPWGHRLCGRLPTPEGLRAPQRGGASYPFPQLCVTLCHPSPEMTVLSPQSQGTSPHLQLVCNSHASLGGRNLSLGGRRIRRQTLSFALPFPLPPPDSLTAEKSLHSLPLSQPAFLPITSLIQTHPSLAVDVAQIPPEVSAPSLR